MNFNGTLEILNQAGFSTQFIVFILLASLIALSTFKTNFPTLHALCGVVSLGAEIFFKYGIVVYFIGFVLIAIALGYKPKEEKTKAVGKS